jgi:hypothetical protein
MLNENKCISTDLAQEERRNTKRRCEGDVADASWRAADVRAVRLLGALQSGPDLEHPPLIDLADVNLGTGATASIYEYGLHLVALPTPWVRRERRQRAAQMKIGPSVVWELDANGSAGMLEFAGAGWVRSSSRWTRRKSRWRRLARVCWKIHPVKRPPPRCACATQAKPRR